MPGEGVDDDDVTKFASVLRLSLEALQYSYNITTNIAGLFNIFAVLSFNSILFSSLFACMACHET